MGCASSQQVKENKDQDKLRVKASTQKRASSTEVQDIVNPRAFKGNDLRSHPFQSTSMTEKRDIENESWQNAITKQEQLNHALIILTEQSMLDLSSAKTVLEEDQKEEKIRYYKSHLTEIKLDLKPISIFDLKFRFSEISNQESEQVKATLNRLAHDLRKMTVNGEPFVKDFPPIRN
eukprot:TRINITY_DN25861_c0_g1_i1.p1 TRINITY_DN25861_c0_g1~~TRINITY_DN25861_c0_g1_i1.p1  ORF type:complete len:177 (-),score=45.52 TRINITY_DN25861_c0_g1_i1:71-601(-)